MYRVGRYTRIIDNGVGTLTVNPREVAASAILCPIVCHACSGEVTLPIVSEALTERHRARSLGIVGQAATTRRWS